MSKTECDGCSDYLSHPNDIEKGLCHWCQPEQWESKTHEMYGPKSVEYYKKIEHALRDVENMMRAIHPSFNSIPNAERFIHSCLRANEALRQLQRGNSETVYKYWGKKNDLL